MTGRRAALVVALALLASLVAPAGAAQADPGDRYVPVVTTWSGPGDFEVSDSGNPINAAGMVAGHVQVGGRVRAALFNTRSGNVYQLDGLPAGCDTYALDVNVQDHVVGYQKCSVGGQEVGFFWSSPTDPVRYFDTTPGVLSIPVSLNDHDLVVGAYGTPRPGQHVADQTGRAFLWSPSDPRLSFLGDLGGGETYPTAVNNGGYVTGSSRNSRSQYVPFLWLPEKKKLIALRVPPGWQHAVGEDINDHGYIVGEDLRNDETASPFVWSPVTTHLSLLPAPADKEVFARGINDGGVVVGQIGFSDGVTGPAQGVVWETCGGPPHVLPSSTGHEESRGVFLVPGINVYGRIAGTVLFWDLIPGQTQPGTWWDKAPGEQGAVHLPCRS